MLCPIAKRSMMVETDIPKDKKLSVEDRIRSILMRLSIQEVLL